MRNPVEARRKQLGLSQEELAKQLGITRQYYNAVENGRNVPSVPLAKELANMLGIDWTIFFESKVNI